MMFSSYIGARRHGYTLLVVRVFALCSTTLYTSSATVKHAGIQVIGLPVDVEVHVVLRVVRIFVDAEQDANLRTVEEFMVLGLLDRFPEPRLGLHTQGGQRFVDSHARCGLLRDTLHALLKKHMSMGTSATGWLISNIFACPSARRSLKELV